MSEFALSMPGNGFSEVPMVLSKTKVRHKERSTSYDNCRADYAKNFNYVIISGNFQKTSASEKLKNLYKDIQDHFICSDKLSIYFRLTAFEMESVAYLLKLCKWISWIHQKGNEIKVYWETAPQNVEVRELGEDFAEFCGFPFVIREP